MRKGKETRAWKWNEFNFYFHKRDLFSGGVFRNGHVSHPQQPTAWGHQTVTSVSEQHFPLTSAVIPFSLSSADKGPVCFFKSFHFPLFFISLPNLSLFFSPTLPGSLYLLRANFPPFFFIFWLFPLGVIESPNDLFSLFLWFLFFSLLLWALSCFFACHNPGPLIPICPFHSFTYFWAFRGRTREEEKFFKTHQHIFWRKISN